MLDVRQLKIVDAIVRMGTVTKAAERLFVTQPAVSHGLRQMEARLGVKLFRREGRRMVPTLEGRRLHETARAVLDELASRSFDQFRCSRTEVLNELFRINRTLPLGQIFRILKSPSPQHEVETNVNV